MRLIIGGAYQGKLEFAVREFGLSESGAHICTDDSIELETEAEIVNKLEDWVLSCIKEDLNPVDQLDKFDLSGKTLIITDMSCGVVPSDPLLRAWREGCGRVTVKLARCSDEVYRVFCGIGTKIDVPKQPKF